ncbi:MAG: SDR family NAD(P)-dependent oxidoreductase [Chloroflexi bacterium]|nr:SDR family NAD(P)-dependent oxidoreductase [Chloroflexota bacterium]MDA1296501.1 SDR family NAD(P)-dependent oxidoreductase [Chloroflexota bacterium]
MLLSEKVAVVTGGATGIGRAIGLKLAEQGASILVSDINEDAAGRTADEIAALGVQAAAQVTNVVDSGATDAMAARAVELFGRIDILINNAGVAGAPGWYTRSRSTEEDWRFTYGVNVLGSVNAANSVIPHMKSARYGKILNLASIAGREGRPSLPHYSASKSAIINYTQALAGELAGDNINVNAICPGLLWTPMWEQVGGRYARNDPQYEGLAPRDVFEKMIAANIPFGREQTPEDIGDAAVFLCSDEAKNITGQALNVDGGFFMR